MDNGNVKKRKGHATKVLVMGGRTDRDKFSLMRTGKDWNGIDKELVDGGY